MSDEVMKTFDCYYELFYLEKNGVIQGSDYERY